MTYLEAYLAEHPGANIKDVVTCSCPPLEDCPYPETDHLFCPACWLADVPEERKPCPVDRGKLLIGLECCRNFGAEIGCDSCPYNRAIPDCMKKNEDALAYIGWLEEQLEAARGGKNAGGH